MFDATPCKKNPEKQKIMKIAQIVCTFPPYYGGMGNSVYELSKGLIDLGHDVEVITPQYQKDTDSEKMEYVRRLDPRFSYGNAAVLPQVKSILSGYDLVHLHYPFFGTAGMVYRFKKDNPKIPLVITYHMDPRGSGWKGLLFQMYAKYYMPRVLRSADLLVSASFDYLLQSGAEKIYKENKEKWIEIPFGVDIHRFFPGEKESALLDELGLQRDIPTVLFVGGMDRAHYFKGIPVLLRALSLLKKKRVPFQAIFVGDGDMKGEYERVCGALFLKTWVRFVGKVSAEQLPSYYRLADLFVLPSIDISEAFGMVLLESFASGVPVVASDLPGVRSIANQGGVVVPAAHELELASAIADYFQENITTKGLWARRVRELAEDKFSWEHIAGRFQQEYEKLVRKV